MNTDEHRYEKDRSFAWNLKVKLLGYYMLLLAVLQGYSFLKSGPLGLGFARLQFLLHAAIGKAWGIGPGLEAAWTLIMAVCLIMGKSFLRICALRTCACVESGLTLAVAWWVIPFAFSTPSFHTGSFEDHLRMLAELVAISIVPIASMWLLWRRPVNPRPAT